MNIRKTVLTFLSAVLIYTSFAQINPVYNVQSPEIANLGLFGTIPVSHYSGTPDISIPLHDVKIGNYTLPISMSYHLAAVKPDSQYGCLGMGWNLIAGGYITRSVNLIYDEKQSTQGVGFGFYTHYNKMKNVTTSGFNQLIANSITGSNAYDVCADEFTFNFCGYSGHFYLNEDGNWTVVSDQDIAVEFSPDNGGFIYNTQLGNRISLNRWGMRSENNRYFNKFTLVTPDGCRYEFGGLYATEYSISYYNPNNRDLIPTTWKLSKITTPEGRTIDFHYRETFNEGKPLMCDIRYAPQFINDCGNSYNMVGTKGLVGYIIFPAILESIETSNETINFDTSKDYRYNPMFDQALYALYSPSEDKYDPFHGGIYNTANQFHAFFDIGYTNVPSEIQSGIQAQLASYYLKKISIVSKLVGDSLDINFSYKANRKRKILEEINIVGHREDFEQRSMQYQFIYNTSTTIPDSFVIPETDSWGYYKGSNISLSTFPSYSLKVPTDYATQADILKEIIYPTGGKTVFTCELNSYSKKIGLDRSSVITANGPAGGLRVKEIKMLDSDGSTINIKRYKYTTKKNGYTSSGILGEEPRFSISYHLTGCGDVDIQSQGGFWPSSYNYNTPIVGYSTVFEETLDGDGNSTGYVRYDYSNFDNDIYGNSHLDENYQHFTATGNGGQSRFTSRSAERGKLLAETYYDNNNNVVKKINYRYNTTSTNYRQIASQHIITTTIGGGDHIPIGWLNKLYTYSYLKTSERDTTYAQTGTGNYHSATLYTYNDHKMLKTISESQSKGGNKVTTLYYPMNVSNYSWMENRHIYSTILRSTVSEDGKTETETYDYGQTSSGIPYLSNISTLYDNGAYKAEYHVNVTDNYGNPVEIEKDGMTSVLYWGFYGQTLMAKIDNYTVSEAVSLGLDSPVSFAESEYEWAGEIARKFYNLPPSVHMHIYDHLGPGYLESYMAPTGFATFYQYDGLRRLREEYYYDHPANGGLDKRMLHLYDYKYKNE